MIKDVQFNKIIAMKTLKVSRRIICLTFFGNILTTFHRLFYLKLVDEPTFDNEPQGHSWCVFDWIFNFVSTVDRCGVYLCCTITEM